MLRRSRRADHCIFVLTALLTAGLPATGWTWGFATHHYIAQNYSKHLPPDIDGLRVYDGVVDQKVTDPDTRRPTTPGESYRHYIDIDNYPEFFSGTLSHDRAALEAQYGAATVLENGIVPWAVGEVVATLTLQFQSQQWSAAATTIADLCHYVGDACQPLHCTRNYDGQLTGNNGIHSRYETTMMSPHIGELTTPVTPVTYYANPVDAMFDIVDDSWAGVSPVLEADNTARAASGGSFNSTYYASLWNSTQNLTRSRINVAAVATASFVFTAWYNAGMPQVPGSTLDVPSASRFRSSARRRPLAVPRCPDHPVCGCRSAHHRSSRCARGPSGAGRRSRICPGERVVATDSADPAWDLLRPAHRAGRQPRAARHSARVARPAADGRARLAL